MLCNEKGWEWYNLDAYRKFISFLNLRGIRMQKFPLCIKESGGTYERGKDKAKFLENLSHLGSEDASAYTIKLGAETISAIRSFSYLPISQ
jgi:hypothetical protein